MDFFPILKAFTEIEDNAFHKSFTDGGEHVFLYHVRDRVFLFIMTKNNELIKSINSSTLSQEDIYQKLSKNEELGFASYIYISTDCYGFSNTMHGPRNNAWLRFVNELLKRNNIQHNIFTAESFATSVTKNQALKMSFKGTVRFELGSSAPFAKDVMNLLKLKDPDYDSIEVIIKPKRRKDMPKTYNAILNKLENKDLTKLMVRAKGDLADRLSDFYLVGTRHLTDIITSKHENEICTEIISKFNSNENLKEALKEYRDDETYKNDQMDDLNRLSVPDNWVRSI
jgi:hypothetical protein